MRWVQSERYLADWLARTCYRMEPASEQDQMQCILEEHFLPGMAISIAAIALCFLAALMKFPEMSCVEPLEADGFQTSLHPSEAGPGSWVRMIRDKDLTEEPQVLLGVFTASEACCTFSANVPRFQDVNLIDCSHNAMFCIVLLHVWHFLVSVLVSLEPMKVQVVTFQIRMEVRNPRSDPST